MAKYLDDTGLGIVWGKVKDEDATNLLAAKNYADSQDNAVKSRVSTLEGYFNGNGQALESVKALQDGDGATISSTYIKASTKGVANGVASLDANGRIPSSQIPSAVDEIIEGYLYNGVFYADSSHTEALTGETGKIYVDLSTNKTYRWSGSLYVEISESLAIGTTTGTAYDGGLGAQLASDVSSLQTTVNAIPNTYVSKESPIVNGCKGSIGYTNGNVNTTISYGGTNGNIIYNTTFSAKNDEAYIMTSHTENNVEIRSRFIVKQNEIILETASLKTREGYGAPEKTLATTDQIPSIAVEDVKVGTTNANASSVVSSKNAVLLTKTAYNASSNKLATESDIPVVEAITSQELALILV